MNTRNYALPLVAVLFFSVAPGVALADDPYEPTPDELAMEAAKQPLADAISEYFDTGIWVSPPFNIGDPLGDNEPQACEEHCSPPPPPSNSKTLTAYARQQINGYYCGVASVQEVLNYTWHMNFAGADGEDPAKNWKKQSDIGPEMGTTQANGSSSSMIKSYLNAKAKLPDGFIGWTRSRSSTGKEMYSRIVATVSESSVPVVVAVQPHDPGQQVFLPSWHNEISTVGHFIAIRGYSGTWGGGAQVQYLESAGNGGMGAGPYTASAATMWTVNDRGGSTIVW